MSGRSLLRLRDQRAGLPLIIGVVPADPAGPPRVRIQLRRIMHRMKLPPHPWSEALKSFSLFLPALSQLQVPRAMVRPPAPR